MKQIPTPPNDWLYKDISENERWFSDEICRPKDSEPWLECTNSEKEQWESEHQPKEEENND